MAKTSEYLGEAYEALQKLSADELKRLEYEEREKALRDYNWIINGEKRAREREKRALEQEKQSLEQEKRSLEQEKHSLDQEKHSLDQEKHSLDQEKCALDQERHALKREKQLAGEHGEKRGEKRGIQLTKQVFRLHEQKKTEQEIADECQITVEKVREILE